MQGSTHYGDCWCQGNAEMAELPWGREGPHGVAGLGARPCPPPAKDPSATASQGRLTHGGAASAASHSFPAAAVPH